MNEEIIKCWNNNKYLEAIRFIDSSIKQNYNSYWCVTTTINKNQY